jgi:DNA-binding NarL/FixJ family response regulator
MNQIRILLVEDHFLARQALTSVLTLHSEMKIVATGENGTEAVERYFEHRPDVVIMDLRLPGMSGFDAIRAIRERDPSAHILVVSNYDGSEDIYRALHAGASGYLFKDTSGAELVQAVQATHRGHRYIPRSVGDRLAQRMGVEDLTARELEVLELVAHGRNNREIANALGIAEKTARIHVSNILGKIGVSDRTQAAIAAIQRGLVHLD